MKISLYSGQVGYPEGVDVLFTPYRGTTRYRELVKLGVPRGRAGLGAVGKSPWHMSKSPVVNEALSNAYLRHSGLKSLKARYQELRLS